MKKLSVIWQVGLVLTASKCLELLAMILIWFHAICFRWEGCLVSEYTIVTSGLKSSFLCCDFDSGYRCTILSSNLGSTYTSCLRSNHGSLYFYRECMASHALPPRCDTCWNMRYTLSALSVMMSSASRTFSYYYPSLLKVPVVLMLETCIEAKIVVFYIFYIADMNLSMKESTSAVLYI